MVSLGCSGTNSQQWQLSRLVRNVKIVNATYMLLMYFYYKEAK